jgi:hypothetical protein
MDDKPNGRCESVGQAPGAPQRPSCKNREAQRSVMRTYSIGFSAM